MAMKIGHNVGGGTTYWDALVYRDVIRQAGLPTTAASGNLAGVALRPDGWPTFVTPGVTIQPTVLASTATPQPAGKWRIAAEGSGQFRVSLQHGVWLTYTFTGPRAEFEATTTAPKAAGQNVNINLLRSEASDPLRGLSMLAPGGETIGLFHQPFLDDVAGAAVLRTMDWQMTNTKLNEIVTWADYEAMTKTRYSCHERGAPVADLARLANAADMDLWCCIPYNADDGCIEAMAAELHAVLNPGLAIYVELSNEIWNLGFVQGAKHEAERIALGYSDRRVYNGQRQGLAVNRFKDTLSGTGRVVHRVCAGQAVSPGGMKIIADAALTRGGFDLISPAPYFAIGSANPDVDAKGTLFNSTTDDAVKADILAWAFGVLDEDITKMLGITAQWRTLADSYGCELANYECGQHCVAFPKTAARQALYHAVNRDPRIGTAYTRYLHGMEDVGVDLLVHFNSHAAMSQYGQWGLREYVGQPLETAPKAAAVQAFILGQEPEPQPDPPTITLGEPEVAPYSLRVRATPADGTPPLGPVAWTIDDAAKVSEDADPLVLLATGLEPETDYVVKPRVVDADGRIATATLTIRTAEAPPGPEPEPPVVTLAELAATHAAVRVRATVAEGAEPYGPLTWTLGGIARTSEDADPTVFLATGLEPATDYVVGARVLDALGLVGTATLTVATAEAPPTPPPPEDIWSRVDPYACTVYSPPSA